MSKSANINALERCQKALGYRFKDIKLLEIALIHASVADHRLASNERLEFLGDSILGMVICHKLYSQFEDSLEGHLTKIKSVLVSRRTCAKVADELGLADYLKVGKGMAKMNKLPLSCRAAAYEAVIGAIYLDGGEKKVQKFIIRTMDYFLDKALKNQTEENYKSLLQQHAQQNLDTIPSYEVLDEKGPDHSKCFEVAVVMSSHRFSSAWGSSKKEAEQSAAFYALKELKVIEAGPSEE